ncbi:response regulator, partial [Acidisphaera rubrifaciens]|uniref:response regulator n=1 Tax=Acidisphaera rubrifaciens TaxID=50715 RepID=UPI0006625B3F
MRLLLIEDHPIVRSGVRRMLREHATEIQEAGTASEGLALFETMRPDIVLLDLNLPDMGGLDVLQRLRAAQPAQLV